MPPALAIGDRNMISKRAFLSVMVVVCSLNAAGPATCETYPSRPITMVLPFAAGGPTDTLARILAARMQVSLGQPVIIENVSGAAGTISLGRVARAAPDGYTISVGPMNSHVLTGAIYKLPFDLLNDFRTSRTSGQQSFCCCFEEKRAGKGPEGTDRLGESQSRQSLGRNVRCRSRHSPRRHLVRESYRYPCS